ncbi:MAG: hypothetical protein HY881_26280 [Deltaproteobacteria bacterium]|nr:hypothetical protein [Deltaproteobacteria bacterium]
MKKLLIPVFLLFCMMNASQGWCNDNTPITLEDARKKVQSEFDRLDAGLKQAAAQLGVSGLTGDAARKVLAELCGDFSYAVDCATLGPDGKMLTVEPVAYRRFEGADVSGQEQVRRVMQGQKPVFSSVFVSVEGFDALDVEYPVTTGDGKYLGSVSLLFRPEKFLGDIIRPLVEGIPMDITVMETGGRTLYDADEQQIGQNLFSSPLFQPYPSLIALGRQMAMNPSGVGKYTFPDRTTKAAVTKEAYWQTASMYGTDWRLVGIHVEPKSAGHRALPVKVQNPDRPLESFADSNVLIKALERGDSRSIMKLFRKFHKDNPGIYAIQWIDEKGINRFGYPVENSLKNYDLRSDRSQSDPELLKAVQEKKPGVFEFPLFEGNRGIFTLMPVFSGEHYLGMVYVIVIK